MSVIKNLNTILKDIFIALKFDENLASVSLSNRPDLCQFTSNSAMSLAKQQKRKPIDIGNEICEKLLLNEIVEKAETIAPGFINISLKYSYFEYEINKISSFCDLSDKQEQETIIIDYGGPNVAKPLHIGHLRSAIIGESIKRICKYLGHNVIGDVHLGDWGLQMGLVISEIKERYPNSIYFQENYIPSSDDNCPVTINELNEIYPFASNKSKKDELYKEKAFEATRKLQNKEIGYYNLWKQIVAISIEDIKKSYKILNVDFDLWNGESSCNQYIDELIKILESKNLLYESDGAMIVDVKEDSDKLEVPPVIIKKFDGSQLYATTDLATIMQRDKEYSPNLITYIVDNRQSLHFKQIFRVARKAELIPESTVLSFDGFGTMNGNDGKPYKTREGGVMKLSDLLDVIIEEGYKKIDENLKKQAQDNYIEITEEEKREIGKKVGIAALKFGDLYNHRTRDYIFDIERFISFQGKTGPYLLYSVARINSILRKSETNFHNSNILVNSEFEFNLILKILLTEDIILKAFYEKAPNFIAEHVYDLAVIFSKFYDEHKILTEKDEKIKASRIKLIKITKEVIEGLLDLLAIETVDRM